MIKVKYISLERILSNWNINDNNFFNKLFWMRIEIGTFRPLAPNLQRMIQFKESIV